MINKNCEEFQYNSGDLVYIISLLTSQLRINSRKVTIKYVGSLVVYKIVDPHNYLLMTLDGNVNTLAQLKQVLYRNANVETCEPFCESIYLS